MKSKIRQAVMLRKYVWCAMIAALAMFVLSCVSARSMEDTILNENEALSKKLLFYSTREPRGGTTGRIKGMIMDDTTKEPIPGAVITIVGTAMGANTDLDGRYTILNVPVGTYSVQANMMGYDPKKITGVKAIMDTITTVNFKLKSTIIEMEGAVVKKPNIYLYPTKQETLTVKIHPIGKITTSIPEYNTGWNIVVVTGGRINDAYDFLFYEATVDYNFTLDAGWILQSSDFDRRMNEVLVNLGLNDKERADFMDYWSKRMDWKKKYCIAYYLKREELDKAVHLTISKTPESLMRLFFKFVPTDTLVTVPEPKIEKFQRIGFTVVEWGGILENEK